ncbi:MAG: hypothetical protein KF789_06725 [Bdellovibrionaceae bacterium]|nr:hypothetical protein [Pseudobdellovibrionaceae bacterium]
MIRLLLIFSACLATTACGPGFRSLDQLADYVWNPIPNENREYPDMTPSEEVITSGGTTGYRIRGAIGEVGEDVTTSNGWKVRGVFHE